MGAFWGLGVNGPDPPRNTKGTKVGKSVSSSLHSFASLRAPSRTNGIPEDKDVQRSSTLSDFPRLRATAPGSSSSTSPRAVVCRAREADRVLHAPEPDHGARARGGGSALPGDGAGR